jgi:hypothetical protein
MIAKFIQRILALCPCDYSVRRMLQRFGQSIDQAKTQALLLADAFTDRSQQTQVLAAVQHIISSDFNLSIWESTLLMELRKKFRL